MKNRLRCVPTPLSFHQPSEQAATIIEQLAGEVKFFHWELEFPDVFTPQRSGFDAMIGNPPWDVMKPNSQEFFTEFDPLYRTYDKQAAFGGRRSFSTTVSGVARPVGRVQRRIQGSGKLGEECGRAHSICRLARGKEGEGIDGGYGAKHGRHVRQLLEPEHPFRLPRQCRPELVQDVS